MTPTDVIAGDMRLYLGDALEVLPSLPGGSVSIVLADPPYGISLEAHAAGHTINGVRGRRVRSPRIERDNSHAVAEAIAAWADDRGLPLVLFGSPYRPLPGEWRNVLVWDKGEAVGGNGDPAKCWKRTYELIFLRRNGSLRVARDGSVLRFPVGTGADFQHHPCEKPVRLLRYLIRQLTDPGDTILDPTMGSGTTIVAAMREGRKAIGVELDPAHYETARKRIVAATGAGEGQLFAQDLFSGVT